MLLRAPVMVALMRNRRDDGRLSVGPAEALDAGRFAQPRARSVGGDQQSGGNRGTVGELCENLIALDREAAHAVAA
jgi:hypothetical protein